MKITKLIILLAVFIIPFGALAEGEGHAHDADAPAVSTLNGQLIGLTCFLKHDSSGPGHKSCARSCAEKGLPLALKTDDGKLYQILGKGHDDLKTVNASLLDYIETRVTVVGNTFNKDGVYAVVVDKIKKAED